MAANGKPLELSQRACACWTSRSSRPARPARRRWPGSAPRWSRSRTQRRGDPGRSIFAEPDGDSFYFLTFNANKKSLTVDLKSAAGKKLVLDLAAQGRRVRRELRARRHRAPGARLDVVSKINPGIIYAQVKGFGEGSPFENNLAFDMIAQATGGVMSISGEPDGPPDQARPHAGRHRHRHAARHLHPGRALREEDHRQGPAPADRDAGRHAALHPPRLRHPGAQGRAGQARRRPERVGRQSAVRHLPCKGGGPNDYVYVYTSRTNPEHWKRLLGVLGREDLIADPRFATPEARAEHEAEINAIVPSWTKQARQARRPCACSAAPAFRRAPCSTPRSSTRTRPSTSAASCRTMDAPRWSRTTPCRPGPCGTTAAPPAVKASPLLGEHSGDVLQSWLGLGEREIEGLAADKIITQRK